MKRRRILQGLLQRDLADELGISVHSVRKWERATGEPGASFLPRLLDFLGYDPRPEAHGIAARLKRVRRGLGLTQRALAKRLGIDESTVADYESGRHGARNTQVLRQLLVFLDSTEGASGQKTTPVSGQSG